MYRLSTILARSLQHCHSKQVYLLVLDDQNGRLTRIFWATQHHNLHQNVPTAPVLDIAIHSHHCDITMIVLKGEVQNLRYRLTNQPAHEVRNCSSWQYQSALNGSGSFTRQGQQYLQLVDVDFLRTYLSDDTTVVHMAAAELHTVAVPRGERACWMIVEGARDPGYQNICYSEADLTKFDFKQHYLPATVEQVRSILQQAGISYQDDL